MITPLFPHSAALVETKQNRVLVVADLHIGWEMALSEKGIFVPMQTSKLLRKLVDLVAVYRPDSLMILGDVKHTVATAQKAEWQDIPDFFNELQKHVGKIQILRGNHDGNLEPLLPENVELVAATGVAMGDVGLFHGHRWPSPTLLTCKILAMGHVHPVIAFRDLAGFRIIKPVWVRAYCNTDQLAKVLLQKDKTKTGESPEETSRDRSEIIPKTKQLFIVPSFNDFLGGRPLNERRYGTGIGVEAFVGPVLRSEAVDMRNAEAFLLDGTYLGTMNQLQNLN